MNRFEGYQNKAIIIALCSHSGRVEFTGHGAEGWPNNPREKGERMK